MTRNFSWGKQDEKKNEKLTTLKLKFLGIYEANFEIMTSFCLISKKLSHKNAINSKIWPKILPPSQESQGSLGRSKISLI